MGRPSGCNDCCGGGSGVQPPLEGCTVFNLTQSACNYYPVDDLLIQFTRTDPNQSITFEYQYYDWANPIYGIHYTYDECTVCIDGDYIVTAECTIPANATDTSTGGYCDKIRYYKCGSVEYIVVFDAPRAFINSEKTITNAEIVSETNIFGGSCCGNDGYGWGWNGIINDAKCACIEVIVDTFQSASIEYFDCILQEYIGLVISSLEVPSSEKICVNISDWGRLLASIRSNICNNSCDILDPDFTDDIKIISGNPSFRFKGVCEWKAEAPECLQDYVCS